MNWRRTILGLGLARAGDEGDGDRRIFLGGMARLPGRGLVVRPGVVVVVDEGRARRSKERIRLKKEPTVIGRVERQEKGFGEERER
jgi:hypothetical protein